MLLPFDRVILSPSYICAEDLRVLVDQFRKALIVHAIPFALIPCPLLESRTDEHSQML